MDMIISTMLYYTAKDKHRPSSPGILNELRRPISNHVVGKTRVYICSGRAGGNERHLLLFYVRSEEPWPNNSTPTYQGPPWLRDCYVCRDSPDETLFSKITEVRSCYYKANYFHSSLDFGAPNSSSEVLPEIGARFPVPCSGNWVPISGSQLETSPNVSCKPGSTWWILRLPMPQMLCLKFAICIWRRICHKSVSKAWDWRQICGRSVSERRLYTARPPDHPLQSRSSISSLLPCYFCTSSPSTISLEISHWRRIPGRIRLQCCKSFLATSIWRRICHKSVSKAWDWRRSCGRSVSESEL